MKNKAQTTFLSVLAMGFVLCIVMYMYYVSPTKEKTANLESSNATLQARVNELEKFYNEMDENKARIAEMKAGISEIIAEFPADVREEDALYFAIASRNLDYLQDLYDRKLVAVGDQISPDYMAPGEMEKITFASLAIGKPQELAKVEEDVVKTADIEGLVGEFVFQNRDVDFQVMTDYTGLKALVQSVNYDSDKKTLNSISFNTNAEGVLAGVATVRFYSVSGTEKEYVERDFGDFLLGLDNLFVRNVVE